MGTRRAKLIAGILCLFLIFAIIYGLRRGKTADLGKTADVPPVVRTKTGIEMVLIPGGWFEMGSERGSPDERPVHKVWVGSFLMDRYEVTQELYDRFPLPNPSHFKNPKHPMEQMNWSDAGEYCNMRSRAEGLQPCYDEETRECDFRANGYRLPTEAEWEYACRADTSTDYAFGNDARKLKAYAWFAGNSSRRTHPVGGKRPNRWGLYDMHGNVAEWCNGRYSENYYKEGPEKDPKGPARGSKRVLRGGAWNSSATSCRSSYRVGDPSIDDTCLASDAIGFRCVRNLPADMVSEDRATEDTERQGTKPERARPSVLSVPSMAGIVSSATGMTITAHGVKVSVPERRFQGDMSFVQENEWQVIPSDRLPRSFRGDPVMATENVVAAFDSAKGCVSVYARKGNRLERRGTVRPRPRPRAASYRLLPGDGKSGPGIAVCSSRNRQEYVLHLNADGIVEFKPARARELIVGEARMAYGIVPSLIGVDLVYDQRAFAETDRLYVPSMNLFVGLVEGNDSMLVASWPPGKQLVKLELDGAGAERTIDRLAIDTAGRSFYLSWINGSGLWHREPLKAAYLERSTAIGWKRPFDAEWIARFRIKSEEINYPFYFRRKKERLWGRFMRGWYTYPFWFDGDTTYFHFTKKCPPVGEALVYFLDRRKGTPGGASPVQFMKKTLGEDEAAALLDLGGIACRPLVEHGNAVCAMTRKVGEILKSGRHGHPFVTSWRFASQTEPWRNTKSFVEMSPRKLGAIAASAAKARRVTFRGGAVDFLKQFPTDKRENVAGYAMCTIRTPGPRTVNIHTGSDDALRVWLNGRRIVGILALRSASPDSESTVAKLRAGDNTLIAEVSQAGEDWGLYLRLEDQGGDALALNDRGELVVHKAAGLGEDDRARVAQYADDICTFIRLIRERIVEYSEFAAATKRLLQAEMQGDPGLAEALGPLERTLDDIEFLVKRKTPGASLEEVRQWTEQIKKLAAGGHGTNGNRYKKLAGNCTKVAGGQDDLARDLCILTIRLFEQAGALGVHSESRVRLSEQIIARARRVLRRPTWWEAARHDVPPNDPGIPQ